MMFERRGILTALILALPLATQWAFGQTPEPNEDLKRGDVSTETSPSLSQQKSHEETVNSVKQKPDERDSRAGAEGTASNSDMRPQTPDRPHRFERPLRPERPHR